jgi:hypothetical protein
MSPALMIGPVLWNAYLYGEHRPGSGELRGAPAGTCGRHVRTRHAD